MKKVLASLLVLASLASVSGIVSFADKEWDESNYWKHAVNTILNPGEKECANFDECLKIKAEETKFRTDGKFDFDISPFLGSNSTRSTRVKEFNEVNSKWLKVRGELRFFDDNKMCGRPEVLDELSNEEYRLYDERFSAFQPCTDDINHEKSMDLFRALWKVSIYNKETNKETSKIKRFFKIFIERFLKIFSFFVKK